MAGFTSFDPAGASASVTLSLSNLRAACSGAAAVDTGAKGLAADALATGKYYFEVTADTPNGGDNGYGFCTSAATYVGLGSNASLGIIVFRSGTLWVQGSARGSVMASAMAAADVICIAADFTAGLVWVRKNGLLWNNSGTADPATGVGGISFTTATFMPAVVFSASAAAQATYNFGASAFAQAVPSGFTSGWPSTSAANTIRSQATVVS